MNVFVYLVETHIDYNSPSASLLLLYLFKYLPCLNLAPSIEEASHVSQQSDAIADRDQQGPQVFIAPRVRVPRTFQLWILCLSALFLSQATCAHIVPCRLLLLCLPSQVRGKPFPKNKLKIGWFSIILVTTSIFIIIINQLYRKYRNFPLLYVIY